MSTELSRNELLTVLAALQQARAYRRYSKRFIRMDCAHGKISETDTVNRIAHADLIIQRYTDLSTKIMKDLNIGSRSAKTAEVRLERRSESKKAAAKAQAPDSPVRRTLRDLINERKVKKP